MQTDTLALAPEVLAAKLLARALHDIAGATSGLTAAIDLLSETTTDNLRSEALALARESAGEITSRIAFYRAAFGGGEAPGGEAAGRLMRNLFAGSRAGLDLAPLPEGGPGQIIQAILILLQIAATALVAGGLARARLEHVGEIWRARVEGEGPRAKIYPETLTGLAGQDLNAGLSSRWAPARYVRALTDSAGGVLKFETQDGRFWMEVTIPVPGAPGTASN